MIRRSVGFLVAVGTVALVLGASQMRLPAFPSADSIVRVSWSARPERVETCRRLTDEEYAQRPAHMRRRVECEGTTARYELRVLRDSVLLVVDTVRGGGLRHDRELYVSRELTVPSGPARLQVRFVRLDSSQAADESLRADTTGADAWQNRAAREDEERERRRAEAIPAALVVDTTITLQPRRVMLVTYGDAGRRLTVRSGPQ